MSASAARDPVVKTKHVRFARMKEDDNNDDQEEHTLFDKRKDTRRGVKSVMKGRKESSNSGSDGEVEIIGGVSSASGSGGCSGWIITMALCASFLGLGMSISVLGPTFQDLAINVNQDISNISYIFVGRSMGYIGGSVLSGILFDCMNSLLLLGLSMLITAFGMFAIPFCKTALLLTALMSSIGVSMGFLDTGGNVLILQTWGDQAGSHLQALHFSFAAGAFVSPIIAKLLFGTDLELDVATNGSMAAPPVTLTSPPVTDDVFQTQSTYEPKRYVLSSSTLKSMWAYIVISGFILLISLLFFILYARHRPPQGRAQTPSGKHLVSKHHNALIAMLFVFFFWYVGAEVAYGSFIFTYAKDYIHMDEAQAAGLNSLFWGTFAAGRGLAIFFVSCMHPGTMILLSLVGCTLSSLFLTLFSTNRVALWICTGVYGASMSTTFPSGISWVEQYTTVTGSSAAVFVVGAALGEMVLPALMGFLLGRIHGHPLLMYLTLATATMTSILFPFMFWLASSPSGPSRTPRIRGRKEPDDSEYRQGLLDSGANDEEEEQQEDDEADQWNDADFEVIEMDDASLINSPNKALLSPNKALSLSPNKALSLSPNKALSPPNKGLPPPDVTGTSGDISATSVPSTAQSLEPTVGTSFSDSPALLGDSPRQKKLLSLDREKRD
ncbi:sodium-dependent glucose transporter 1 isoform X1 [Oncorhynchus tshawytscha]|uniref:Sodium-dependent glucose transporter 1 n=1 Tax=Oncorhynchus tshawytscha TaxID=74940 RepID=A0AAZ3SLV1_ONCTS|nr:sodium-dependent glucose transporter 1 isoform X1 [Oncorhynchus tshawytscha]